MDYASSPPGITTFGRLWGGLVIPGIPHNIPTEKFKRKLLRIQTDE
jgi:hypothetical protein